MRIRDQGGEWSDWTPAVHKAQWTLPDVYGYRTVEAQYRNGLGTTAVLSDTILLDTYAPQTLDDAPGYWWKTWPLTVTLTARRRRLRRRETEYKLDDAADWTEGTSVRVVGDGEHTLSYRSVDAVGNVEETRFVLVRISIRGPVTSGQPVSARKGRTTRFKVLVSDTLCAGATTGATVVIKSRAGGAQDLPATPVVIERAGDRHVGQVQAQSGHVQVRRARAGRRRQPATQSRRREARRALTEASSCLDCSALTNMTYAACREAAHRQAARLASW